MAARLADLVFLHGKEHFLAAELAYSLDKPERLADHVVVALVARLVEDLLVIGVALLLRDSFVLKVMLQLVAAHDKEWRFKVCIVWFNYLLWPW